MPKIPMIGEAKQSLNVPAPAQMNAQAMGAKDRAIADAAGMVQNAALNLAEKRKKAADNDYAFKTYVDDYQAVEEYSNQLKMEAPEDASGYADKMRNFIDTRRQDSENKASSDDGLRMYREKSTTLWKGAEIEAQNFENTSRAKYYVKSLDESANKMAATFLKNPDYTRAKSVQAQLEIEIENNAQTHFVDVNARENLKKGVRDAVSMSVYDGLDAQERYAEQIKLLKNTDEKTDIFAGMDAEKRGALLRRSMAGLETRRRQGDSDLEGRVADVMQQLMNGDDVDPNALNQLADRVNESGWAPHKKESKGDALRVAAVVSGRKKELLQTPMALWGNAEDAIPLRPDGKNGRVVAKARAALEREMTQMRTMANSDGAAYAQMSSPKLREMAGSIKPGDPTDTQNFDNELLSRQQALGISRPRILTTLQAQQLGQNFFNQSSQEAAHSALALKHAHGKHAPMVFAEITKDGKLPPEAMLVAFTNNHQTATTIIENIKNKPQWDEAFKAKNKTGDDDLMRQVNKKFDVFGSALDRQGSKTVSLSNALRGAVATDVKRQIAIGSEKNLGTAIDNAINTVVKTNFEVVKGGNNSHFVMPKFDGTGQPLPAKTTQAFVSAYSTKEGFKTLNVAVPKDPAFEKFRAPDPDDKMDLMGMRYGKSYESPKDRFYWMLEKQSYWTPTEDNSGIVLVMKHGNRAIAMRDDEGKVIERSYHQITYDIDDLTLAEQTPWFQKIFKSNSAAAGDKK